MRITQVDSHLLRLPPVGRVGLGGAGRPASRTMLVTRLLVDGGLEGIGVAAVPACGEAVRVLFERDIAPLLVGEDALCHERLFARARRALSPAGWRGLAARAYSAADIALWDIKAKAAGLPAWRLWGGARSAAAYFVRDPAGPDASVDELGRDATAAVEKGAVGVLVSLAGGDPEADADLAHHAREALGPSAWLGVSAGGRYDASTALALGRFLEEDVGADWFDEPVPAEDHTGLRRLAGRLGVAIAAGCDWETFADFERFLSAGGRVLRPDLARLGGLTPLLKLCALAELRGAAVVPVAPPELAVSLCCGLPAVPMVEWSKPLDGLLFEVSVPERDGLVPRARRGLGLELGEGVLERLRV